MVALGVARSAIRGMKFSVEFTDCVIATSHKSQQYLELTPGC